MSKTENLMAMLSSFGGMGRSLKEFTEKENEMGLECLYGLMVIPM